MSEMSADFDVKMRLGNGRWEEIRLYKNRMFGLRNTHLVCIRLKRVQDKP